MEARGSPDQEFERIVQVREALMCPDGEKFEGLRTARFLNYTTTSIDDDVFDLSLEAFASPIESTAKISFSGWGSPSVNWIEWVNAMAETHATVWRKSGVHDAIMGSRYQIKKQDDLMMALVEKWCLETNTFVFPWGEATVTLEDMIVLGGFSVIGNNALGPLKREPMKEVEEKMKKAKRVIEADVEKKCSVSSWMKEMMNSGNEIEHEAFMVSWLSRFVFPNSADLLREKLFSAAIQLANGVKLALAPAVLSRIYSELGVLKEHLVGNSGKETVVVKSPFQFVQVWAFERFMELEPPGQPSQLKLGEPRIARWHQHGGGQDAYGGYPENVRAVLDSAKESFDYRPYTKPLSNYKFPNFYLENDCWVHVGNDENIIAFGRCLRFSRLVGLDCIEPYYPHRVALQFGYDQDVPGVVPPRSEGPEWAWKDYIRPISDEMLYIPARLHEADVTVGYIRWWKLSVTYLQAEAKKISQKRLAALSPKPKSMNTTTKASSFSGAIAEGKDQELVKKREKEIKKGISVTGSEKATKQPVKMPEWVQRSPPAWKKIPDRSSGRAADDLKGSSVTGSEQATKQPSKKLEWVQRSPPAWKKSPDTTSTGRAADDVKDLKGALRGSGGTKSHGHVTFQLPGSSPGRSPSKTQTLTPKQSDSPVKKPRMLPRVADMAKHSNSSPRVALPPKPENNYIKKNNSPSPQVSKEVDKSSSSFSGSLLKRKKSPRSPETFNSKNSPSPRGSKGSNKSSSSDCGCPSSTSKKSPRSPEAVNSHGNKNSPSPRVSKHYKSSSFCGSPSLTRKKSPRSLDSLNSCGNTVDKRNTDRSIVVGKPEESPRKTLLNNVKILAEEMVTLREQVGEGGEVTYQIPKQQFEDLTQGVQDVLQDLQSIKFALNIQEDDDNE